MMHLRPTMHATAPAMHPGSVCGAAATDAELTTDAAATDCPMCLHWHRLANLDEFTQGYITCALWSSHDESTPDGGSPMDSNYSESDIAPETLLVMVTACAEFQKANAALIAAAIENGGKDSLTYSEARAGHDFWLTRNGHGAGFWDRGLGATGDKLSDAARACGNVDLYVGDDKKIWQM